MTGLSRQVRYPHLEEEHDEVTTTVEVGVEVGLEGVGLGVVPREELGEDKWAKTTANWICEQKIRCGHLDDSASGIGGERERERQ